MTPACSVAIWPASAETTAIPSSSKTVASASCRTSAPISPPEKSRESATLPMPAPDQSMSVVVVGEDDDLPSGGLRWPEATHHHVPVVPQEARHAWIDHRSPSSPRYRTRATSPRRPRGHEEACSPSPPDTRSPVPPPRRPRGSRRSVTARSRATALRQALGDESVTRSQRLPCTPGVAVASPSPDDPVRQRWTIVAPADRGPPWVARGSSARPDAARRPSSRSPRRPGRRSSPSPSR